MRVEEIKLKNFLSYKELDLKLSQGLNIITGANGSGKSSLLESVVWGVFGKTQRNSLEKHIPNAIDPNKASVCLTLDQLKIERQKNPSHLSYSIGDYVVRKKTNTETQEDLEKVLNTKYKTFLATCYYDDALRSPFLELTAEERRTIICDFFDFSKFIELRKKVKSKLDEQQEFVKAINVLSNTKTLQKTFNKKLKNLETEIKYLKFWYEALGDNCILKNLLSPLFANITNRVNDYLKLLFAEKIFISIQSDYDVYLKIDDKELSPKSLSLSQKKRLNLAIMLALSDELDDIRGSSLGIKVFDEFTSTDAETRVFFIRLLEQLAKKSQVIVVTHDLQLANEISGAKFVVSIQDKFSVVQQLA